MKLYQIVKSCDIIRIMKKVANPFSTGGGGNNFENHIDASFVALMLTGGYAPCLRCWPITKIKFQNKIRGYETDDILVIVEDANSKKQQRLIGQIKYSINITKGDTTFGRVIEDAWKDFNNAKVFKKGEDIIALITGPLSQPDVHNVPWLLNQARLTEDVDEFFTHVKQGYFSSCEKREKFDAIRHHLKVANGNKDVPNNELYEFLRHFYILGYDLGNEYGVVLSLLHSHMSQFQPQYLESVWSRIVNIVQIYNQNAGTITRKKLPDDLLEEFEKKSLGVEMPEEFKTVQKRTDWMQHPDATYLALVVLIGAWQDKSQYDREVIAQLLGISYDEWLKKVQEILCYPDNPLSLKDGVWKVVNRTELWDQLGVRILDKNIDTFKLWALSVLKESDPAFEMPAEERYMANIHGKVMKYSPALRQGIAEGLAILSTHPDVCSNCSQGKVEATCGWVINQLLAKADHVLWGSLNDLLPTLAEVDPDKFLVGVEDAMSMMLCPFMKLSPQEGNGITGNNYLTGLLWALEGIAWDEKQLVRACVVLSKLASYDTGGQRANRPSNSLATILMPWFPQTLASVDKRKVAVQTIIKECSGIVAWNFLLQLLPSQNKISSRTHKPIWRKSIPDDWKDGVTIEEYWQQVSFYVELAVDNAGRNADKISKLIYYFDNLPEPDLDKILLSLTSHPILDLPEEQLLSIWEYLIRFTKKHRRYSYAKSALSNGLITRIEQFSDKLVPKNLFNLYQHLFSDRDSDFYDDNKNLQEQEEKINTKRKNAISEIFQQDGVEGVIQFAETVSSPHRVGQALIVITDSVIEGTLLPHFLDTSDDKHKALVSSFIWSNHFEKGWEWSDNIDKSVWTSVQIGQFLAYLPFTNKAWERASEWLQGEESEYWTRANVDAYYADGDITIAIDKLIENDRPHAAINCLDRMRSSEQTIDTNQCIRVLRAALLSREPSHTMNVYNIVELIKFLQANPSVNQDKLCEVEREYVPLLDQHGGITPRTLERKLANDPKYFCEIIQLIYRSNKEERLPEPTEESKAIATNAGQLLQGWNIPPGVIELIYRSNKEERLPEPTEESKAIATNAWQLLQGWNIPPGTRECETFSEENFIEWIQNVKAACIESGHLKVALANIGKVLIHAPPDPKGLWIHHAVAKELNNQENDDMRKGFRMGEYNSRGAYRVIPTAKPEIELAEKFRDKAEDLENAGFHRFAKTLKDLADGYDKEDEWIINDYKDSNDE